MAEEFLRSTKLLSHELGAVTLETVGFVQVILASEKYSESAIYSISSRVSGKLWFDHRCVVGYSIDAIPTTRDHGNVTFYILAGDETAVVKCLRKAFSSFHDTQFQESSDFSVLSNGLCAKLPATAVVKMLQTLSYSIRNQSKSIKVGNKALEYYPRIHFQVEDNLIWVTTDAQCRGTPVTIPLEDAEDYLHKQVVCVSTKGNTFYGTLQEVSSLSASEYHDPVLGKLLGPLWNRPEVPSVQDYWALKGAPVSSDERVAFVKAGNVLCQPWSKIMTYKREFLPPLQRDHAIREITTELGRILALLPALKGCRLHAPVLRQIPAHDLLDYGIKNRRPLKLQLGFQLPNGKKTVFVTQVTRDPENPVQFRGLPSYLLGKYETKLGAKGATGQRGVIQPIGGPQHFHVLYILPRNWHGPNSCTVEEIHDALSKEMEYRQLAMPPTTRSELWLPKMPLKKDGETAWVAAFDYSFAKAREKVIASIPPGVIPVVILSTRTIGITTRNLKNTLENCVYERVRNGDLPNTLRAVQGFDFAKTQTFRKRVQKLAISIYQNAIGNIPAGTNGIDPRRGVIYCSNIPLGEPEHTSQTIFAGYDASGEYLQDTGVKATGAILLIMDQYGRKIDSAFVPNELSNAGSLSPKAIRDMFRAILDQMDIYDVLDKRIILVIDGIYQKRHRENLRLVYSEFATVRRGQIPEITVLAVPKSEAGRAFWYHATGIRNPAPGLYFDTSPSTFVLINHQVLQGKHSTRPTVYKYHERLTVDREGKVQVFTTITPEDKMLVALKLFYTSFLSPSYDSRPTRLNRMVHGAHKTSALFHYCPASLGLIKEKI